MKLTLIMPSIGRKPGQGYIATWQMEPLVLAVLGSLTPPDWDINVLDDRLEPIDYDQPTDLVGITLETYTARRGYQIAAEYQRRGVKVVMGGFHATLWTDEVLQYADAVVVGPAEGSWPQVLQDFQAGSLQRLYRSERDYPWGGILPRREIYADKKYLPLALVEFSRGCRFHCNFCAITAFTKGSHRFRPPDEVAEEIRRTGQKIVFLIDDNIAANPPAAYELCKALKPLGIQWVSQISVDAAADPKLVSAMADSGCIGVLIGFETLREDLIQRLNKRCNVSMASYERALDLVREHGICVYGTFLFGIDGDKEDSFPLGLEFMEKHKLFLAAFNHLVPFPGTPLYAKLEAENRLCYPAWWLSEEFRFGHVPFKPTHIGADRLAHLCKVFRRKFYSMRSMVRRGLDVKVHLRNPTLASLFVSQNLYGRREVDEKFGLPLGFQDEPTPVPKYPTEAGNQSGT